jgi:hypothetical protein
MNKRTSQLWFVSILLIIIITLTTLCVGNNSNDDDEKKYDNINPDEHLELFYIGANYLIPDPPDAGSENITELSALDQKSFGTSIFDRKFNNDFTPELHLWLDTNDKEGLRLEFEIFFQAVEDNTILPDKNFKALFESYTNNNISGVKYSNISFIEYAGEPFDIKPGAENLCHVTLTVKRTDNITNSIVHIYVGAENKTSFIRIPYDQTYSAYEYAREQDREKDKKSTPGFTAIQLVVVTSIALLFHFFIKAPPKRPITFNRRNH